MSGSVPASTGDVAPGPRAQPSVRRSAALVSVLTVASRVVGLIRQLAFQAAVGTTVLGGVYTTANYVPNVMFEVVAGGALAALVVPLVGAGLARGDVVSSRHSAAALLGWSLALLVPLAGLVAVFAEPIIASLLGAAGGAAAVETGAAFLRLFAIQVPLYGVAVVTAGVLQSHHRFGAAASAPLVSGVVLIATYLGFAQFFDTDLNDLSATDPDGVRWLAIGTTLGVAALALTTLVPTVTGRLLARPTLRFPQGQAGQAKVLAITGLAGVVAQQVALVVCLRVVNGQGGSAAVVVFANTTLVFLLPFAVLAVPLVTAAFPRLVQENGSSFDRTAAWTSRTVQLASAVGTAMLIAVSTPVAIFFRLIGQEQGQVPDSWMANGLLAFAPALFGMGLLTALGRTLVAGGRPWRAAGGISVGWFVVAVAALALGPVIGSEQPIVAVGLAHTIGMTVCAVVLGITLHRTRGASAVTGLLRTGAVAVFAAAAGGGLGWLLADWLPEPDTARAAVGVGTVVASAAVFMCGALLAADPATRSHVRSRSGAA